VCAKLTLKAPVAFFIFNRPDVTARVFERIAAARPEKLIVVADGARPSRPGEAEKCAAVRKVVERIDWPCDLHRDYSEANLGCGKRISSGLNAIFGEHERAIILEDDTLPDPTFFAFCDELLERYADDSRILHISGNNFQPASYRIPYSYYFSRYPHLWGWATWRRAWKLYDFDMKDYTPDGSRIAGILPDPIERKIWTTNFDQIYHHTFDTWDFQWAYACFKNGGLGINPAVNLVSNIGFGAEATHTNDTASALAAIRSAAIGPLRHPSEVAIDQQADAYTLARIFGGDQVRAKNRWHRRAVNAAKSVGRGIVRLKR